MYSAAVKIETKDGEILKKFIPIILEKADCTQAGSKSFHLLGRGRMLDAIKPMCAIAKIKEIEVFKVSRISHEYICMKEYLKLNKKKYNLSKITEFIKAASDEKIPMSEFYHDFPELQHLSKIWKIKKK